MTRPTVRRIDIVPAAAAMILALASSPGVGLHAQPAPNKAAPRIFELAIANGRVAAAADPLRVRKGDAVELRWTSDRPITLHLHGYDIERRVAPQAPSAMAFTARLTGRFPITEHHHGGRHERALVYLEVHP